MSLTCNSMAMKIRIDLETLSSDNERNYKRPAQCCFAVAVSKFCGLVSEVTAMIESGVTDEDRIIIHAESSWMKIDLISS